MPICVTHKLLVPGRLSLSNYSVHWQRKTNSDPVWNLFFRDFFPASVLPPSGEFWYSASIPNAKFFVILYPSILQTLIALYFEIFLFMDLLNMQPTRVICAFWVFFLNCNNIFCILYVNAYTLYPSSPLSALGWKGQRRVHPGKDANPSQDTYRRNMQFRRTGYTVRKKVLISTFEGAITCHWDCIPKGKWPFLSYRNGLWGTFMCHWGYSIVYFYTLN